PWRSTANRLAIRPPIRHIWTGAIKTRCFHRLRHTPAMARRCTPPPEWSWSPAAWLQTISSRRLEFSLNKDRGFMPALRAPHTRSSSVTGLHNGYLAGVARLDSHSHCRIFPERTSLTPWSALLQRTLSSHRSDKQTSLRCLPRQDF